MKTLLVTLVLFVVVASAVPGNCPKLRSLAKITDLNKAMGLWWRPFRSRMDSQEPFFKCLSTEWLNLKGKRFKVIDHNVRVDNGEKINWNGHITALHNLADWDIQFDQTANFKNVSAQILDWDADKFMFMYVCNPDADGKGHTENGIIFTRQKKVSSREMQRYMDRSKTAMRINRLYHINMLPIDLNC